MKEKPTQAFAVLTSIFLAAILGLYLLFPGFHGYATIAEEKYKLFLITCYGYIIVIFLFHAELAVVEGKKLANPMAAVRTLNLQQKALLVYWLLSVASTVFSVAPRTAFLGGTRSEGLVTITAYCFCALFVSLYHKLESWLVWLIGAVFTIESIFVIAQLLGYNPLGLYPQGMTYYDGNVLYAGQFAGTIGNIDILSAVLSMAIPALCVALVCLPDKRRFLLLAPLALCVGVLLKLSVAGGILGVIGSMALSLPLLVKKARRKKVAALVIALAIATVGGLYFFGARTTGSLREGYEILHGNIDDNFGSGRIYIWRNILPLVKERPLFGGGPDTLSMRTDAAFRRVDNEHGMVIIGAIDSAHNDYLGVLVNQGAFALLSYLTLLITTLIKCAKCMPENTASIICFAAILGYCIQGFFGVSSPLSTIFLFIILAIIIKEPSKSKGGRK